jgi:hypothetical protein
MQHRQLGSVSFHRSDQLVLDFFLDHFQPMLGSRGAALKTFDFDFQPTDPILGGSQLPESLCATVIARSTFSFEMFAASCSIATRARPASSIGSALSGCKSKYV